MHFNYKFYYNIIDYILKIIEGKMTTKQQSFDINQWIEQLKRCEYIKESEVKALCNRAKEILIQESNV